MVIRNITNSIYSSVLIKELSYDLDAIDLQVEVVVVKDVSSAGKRDTFLESAQIQKAKVSLSEYYFDFPLKLCEENTPNEHGTAYMYYFFTIGLFSI